MKTNDLVRSEILKGERDVLRVHLRLELSDGVRIEARLSLDPFEEPALALCVRLPKLIESCARKAAHCTKRPDRVRQEVERRSAVRSPSKLQRVLQPALLDGRVHAIVRVRIQRRRPVEHVKLARWDDVLLLLLEDRVTQRREHLHRFHYLLP